MPETATNTAVSTANGGNLLNTGGPALLNAGSTLLGTIAGYKANKKLAEQQQEWNEQMMDKQNEWSLNMWNKTNAYNSPEQQVQRLRDAGLNPLYFGLDGSSANGLESAQALGYQRAEAPNFGNVGVAALEGAAMAKEIELKNAQIDRLAAETGGVELDNEFKEKTLDARAQAETLKNSLTKEQISNIKQERKNMEQEFKKLIAETDNENRRGLLIEAQTNLAKMQENEIAALLPYRQLLIQAETEAQKASAAASFARAAIDNGLLEAGYVEKTVEKMQADIDVQLSAAERNEYEAALAEFKSNLRNGKAIDLSKYEGKPVGKALARFMNALYQDFALIGEALGPATGVIAGAALVGGKNRPQPASPSNPTSKGSYTTLYGPDGNSVATNTW